MLHSSIALVHCISQKRITMIFIMEKVLLILMSRVAIGILFEQASSRGHAQQTSNGLLTFPFTIKNQFITTLSTLEGAKVLRKEFLSFQKEFYKNAMAESTAYPVKAYVFGNNKDEHSVEKFITMLKRHQIEVYSFKNPLNVSGNNFRTCRFLYCSIGATSV